MGLLNAKQSLILELWRQRRVDVFQVKSGQDYIVRPFCNTIKKGAGEMAPSLGAQLLL